MLSVQNIGSFEQVYYILSQWGATLNKYLGTTWGAIDYPPVLINLGALSAPPTPTADGGLRFANGSAQTIGSYLKLPEVWVEGSDIYPVIHYKKEITSAGDVQFEWRYRWQSVGENEGDWGSWLAIEGDVILEAARLGRLEGAPATGASKTIGSILQWELRRRGDLDGYNGNVTIIMIGFMYKRTVWGSFSRYLKE